MEDPQGYFDSIINIFLGHLIPGAQLLTVDLKGLLKPIIGIDLLLAALAWIGSYVGMVAGLMVGMLKAFTFVFLLTAMPMLTLQFIDFAVWGGLTLGGMAGGTLMDVDEFKSPSTVVGKGFEATVQLNQFINSFSGPEMVWNFHTLSMMSLAALGTWICHLLMAIHIAWVLLATYLAGGFCVLTVPFGAFGPLSFIAQRGIGMFVASTVRLALAACVTAIVMDYLAGFYVTVVPEVDVSMADAFWMLGGSIFGFILSYSLPAIANAHLSGLPLLSMPNIIPGTGMFGGGGSSGGRRADGHGSPQTRVDGSQGDLFTPHRWGSGYSYHH